MRVQGWKRWHEKVKGKTVWSGGYGCLYMFFVGVGMPRQESSYMYQNNYLMLKQYIVLPSLHSHNNLHLSRNIFTSWGSPAAQGCAPWCWAARCRYSSEAAGSHALALSGSFVTEIFISLSDILLLLKALSRCAIYTVSGLSNIFEEKEIALFQQPIYQACLVDQYWQHM